MWAAPFPVRAYSHNSFYDSVGPLLGLVMCLSYLYPLGMLIKGLVEEKESRAREIMRIMGMKEWPLAAAWWATYLVLFIAVAAVAAAVLRPAVFPNSDYALLAAFLFCFALSCIPLGFLISCFFSRARLASIFGPFALFALILPRRASLCFCFLLCFELCCSIVVCCVVLC